MAQADPSERAVRVAAMRRQQQSADRRRALIIWSAAAAVLVLIFGSVAWVVLANRPAALEGLQTFENLPADHVTRPVEYEQTPPVGGDHHPAWWNCGVYEEELPSHHAVHSLEHGAVWLTYEPGLPDDQVEQLRGYAADEYMLLSPQPGQASPVKATAWGHQLALDSADDPRIASFIRAYRQGPQTPEPGAACTGGTGVDLLTGPTPVPAPAMDEPVDGATP